MAVLPRAPSRRTTALILLVIQNASVSLLTRLSRTTSTSSSSSSSATTGLRPLPAGFASSSAARRSSIAPSIAPSTYYDGSIYEGHASSSRAASVLSFPAPGAYGGHQHPVASTSSAVHAAPSLRSPSLAFPSLSPQQSRVDSIASSSGHQHIPVAGPSGLGFALANGRAEGSQEEVLLSASPQSQRSGGRWGLGNVFAGDGLGGSSGRSHNPLKRSPSNASIAGNASSPSSNPAAPPPAPTIALPDFSSMDPKKAKKEMERLAKEQEKANRLAKEQAARERARAVMKKKNQLMEAADPLHNFASHSRTPAGAGGAAGAGGGPTALEKGKGRAVVGGNGGGGPNERLVQQRMPQIIEDTSRLQVSPGGGGGAGGGGGGGGSGASMFGSSGTGSFLANRFKARRRDDDDDVHSVSSNETGHSSLAGGGGPAWPFPVGSGRGRTFSISSKATSASDPEQRRHRGGSDFPFPVTEMDPLARVSSISSLPAPSISGGRLGSVGGGGGAAGGGGSLHRFSSYGHYTAPSTGHSSLDSRFIGDMAGLATTSNSDLPHLASHHTPHTLSSHRSESHSRQRLASPHHERYSPYTLPSPHAPRSPGPILPPISSFDQAQQQHLLHHQARRGSTAAASIASFHSQPGTMPSYFVQPAAAADGGVVPGSSNGGGTFSLPPISAMDTDPPPPSAPPPAPAFHGAGELASPVSATFPYPSPSLTGADQKQQQQVYGRGPPVPHHMATG